MTLLDSIRRADELRPNAISNDIKAGWVFELEGRLAEYTKENAPENTFPEDSVLSIPSPYDNVYELYLCAMIDYYNQESSLYQNDMEVYDTAFKETIAWIRRTNRLASAGNWKVWL